MTRERLEGLVLGLCIAWGMACTTHLPMHEWRITDAEVADVKRQLNDPSLDEARIKDPKIDFAFEVTVPCGRMLEICYPGINPVLKLLGAVPLGCTTYYQHVWRDQVTGYPNEYAKTAIAYTCWASPGFVKEHERLHLQGKDHL